MFTNKSKDGRNNVCGTVIAARRKEMGKSQRQIADMLQLAGLDLDKNAVQRIEAGTRFITDIEIQIIAKTLHVPYSKLLD